MKGESKIVYNGIYVEPRDYSYLVIVLIKDEPTCTGTLVSRLSVLTTASCAKNPHPKDVSIQVNITYLYNTDLQ